MTFQYWQRACLRIREPADRVVLETDPAEAARLLMRLEYGRLDVPPGKSPIAGYFLRPHTEFARRVKNASGLPPEPVVFLGERQTRRGRRLLFCLQVSAYGANPSDLSFSYVSYEPAKWWQSAADVEPLPAGGMRHAHFNWSIINHWRQGLSNRRVRVFAGQPDPADAARIFVPFELEGVCDTIDVTIVDEDVVTYEIRSNTPLPPAWKNPPETAP